MRIIGGRLKNRNILAPKNLPVRPTTDQAKEALFNILQHQVNFEDCTALDLFSGTGNITYELASRGVQSVLALDIHTACCKFIQQSCKTLAIETVQVKNADVFDFIQHPTKQSYDLIFADPPYNHPELIHIPDKIFENKFLKPDGIFILEHRSLTQIKPHPNYKETRKYGSSSFSIYINPS
jgi:16S rRNA (guanine966-N2)-methyltransferase